MSGTERESNPPGGDEQGATKRDPELENTLPDGGPGEPEGSQGAETEVKPQLKRTMMGIDPDAAKKLKELAAAADAARAEAKTRREAAKKAKADAPAKPEPTSEPEDDEEEEDAFAAATEMVDPETQQKLIAKATGGDSGSDSETEEDDEGSDEDEEEGEEEDDEGSDEDEDEDEEEEDEGEEGSDEDEDEEEEEEEDEEAEGSDEDEDEEEEEEEGEEAEAAGIFVRYYGRTDVGLIREHNEDNFTIVDVGRDIRGVVPEEIRTAPVGPRGAVFAVCDGMGGAAAGEVASQMAVDTVYEYFSVMGVPKTRDHFAQRVTTAIEEAGNRIFSAAKMDRTRRGMGTTATVAGLIDKVLFVGQVGDSRAYLLRNGELGLITKDQSLVNQLIEAGQLTEEEAEAFEHSNIILQALGTTEEVTVDLTFVELRRGDRLMMCSDGLSGLVHPDMIKDTLAETSDLVACCDKLIDMANGGGGHDNITVVCVDFDGEDLDEPEPGNKPMYVQYPLPPGLEEERESLVPHEPQMKAGGRKPGADVKRSSDDTPAGRPHAKAGLEQPGINWSVVLGALVLATIVTAIILAMRDDGEHRNQQYEPDDSTEIGPEPEQVVVEESPDVEVRISTDIDGELYIDGERFGPIADGDRLLVMLPPSAYRFEARSGDDVVAEEVVVVSEGEPVDISLTLPSGAVDAIDDPEDGDDEEEIEVAPAPSEPRDPAPREPRDPAPREPTGGAVPQEAGSPSMSASAMTPATAMAPAESP